MIFNERTEAIDIVFLNLKKKKKKRYQFPPPVLRPADFFGPRVGGSKQGCKVSLSLLIITFDYICDHHCDYHCDYQCDYYCDYHRDDHF